MYTYYTKSHRVGGIVVYFVHATGDFGSNLQHHHPGATVGAEKGSCQCKYLLVSGPVWEGGREGMHLLLFIFSKPVA